MGELPTRVIIQGCLLAGQVLLNYTDTFNGKQKQKMNSVMGAVQMALLIDGYFREVSSTTPSNGVAGMVTGSGRNYLSIGKGIYHV